ncbi:MAG: recombination regulator RecX [Oscillospiraceae bacterium]|nr:recombination regulator RecX [Oscillospiraceae bacterium]
MITVESINISGTENAVSIELSNNKKYKILLKDYDNLPFVCREGSNLEDTASSENTGFEPTETNDFFEGGRISFLRFLSRKYTIYNSAVSKVAFSDMSKKSLYQKLYYSIQKNQNKNAENAKNNKTVIEPEELKSLCSLVCDEFEQAGYINDKKYAFDRAVYLKEYKKYGVNRIRDYLYQKGVGKTAIDEALEDEFFADEEGDFENMLGLLGKKFRSGLDKTDRKETAKAINLLARNGYAYHQAKKAVAAFTEDGEE